MGPDIYDGNDIVQSPEPGATSPRTTEGVAIDMLPSSTLEFAHRMFDAAREGNIKLLIAAVDAGLPVNLANEKGELPFPYLVLVGHRTKAPRALM